MTTTPVGVKKYTGATLSPFASKLQLKKIFSLDRFCSLVDSRFFKHVYTQTLIPPKAGKLPNKKEVLTTLFHKIEGMRYVPHPPRGFVVSHKRHKVARFVPSLYPDDYFVYYYCIKELEQFIARNKIKGTYGGWLLGGAMRKKEVYDIPISAPENSFNKMAWKKAYTDFQKHAYSLYKKDYKYYAHFDIANFYDSIRLDLLEDNIRSAAPSKFQTVINLLFYLLRNQSKREFNYRERSLGVPQDEIGDCSRILANYYLQRYDAKMNNSATKGSSVYLRYADDQIVATQTEHKARKYVFIASKELNKIGLNLNASKVEILTRDEFYKYWSFDIFELLEIPSPTNFIAAVQLYEEKKKSGIKFKKEPVLRRMISCNLKRLPPKERNLVLQDILEESFLLSSTEYYLGEIFKLLSSVEKVDFLKKLSSLSRTTFFNEFHLRVLRFGGKSLKGKHKQHLDNVKKDLAKLNDLNIR